jgi:hypothetical protein
MGRAKDWQMEQEERGWWSVPGKFVCSDCFDEDYLKQVVRDNVESSACDYCGLTAEELTGKADDLITAPLDSVMGVIAEGLQSEWNNADDEGITYETAEGGYQANTLDSYDLVWDYVCPNNDALAAEIISALPDHVWVERHYYSLSQDQALWYGWKDFRDLVKHRNRYMFHLRPRKPISETPRAPHREFILTKPVEKAHPVTSEHVDAGESDVEPASETALRSDIPLLPFADDLEAAGFDDALEEAQEGISASRMLDAIGESIEQVDLIRTLTSLTKLFRGRVGPRSEPYRTARKLGPPPQNKASANRMSPAGIPMFYGALEEYTAIAETVLGALKRLEIVNVGTFVTLDELRILDLTNLRSVPSIFSEQRYLRPVLKFLHSFVRDLSRGIKKDGREHIEYVPTQIVTEYFRYSFVCSDGQPVQGILYPSARALRGTACVLFLTREECGAVPIGAFKNHKKQWLRLVRGSAKALRRKPRKPTSFHLQP